MNKQTCCLCVFKYIILMELFSCYLPLDISTNISLKIINYQNKTSKKKNSSIKKINQNSKTKFRGLIYDREFFLNFKIKKKFRQENLNHRKKLWKKYNKKFFAKLKFLLVRNSKKFHKNSFSSAKTNMIKFLIFSF